MRNTVILSLLLVIISAALFGFVSVPMYRSALVKYDYINDLHETLEQCESLQQQRDELLQKKNSISVGKRTVIEQAITNYSFSEVVRFMIALNTLLGTTTFGSSTPYSIGSESEEEGNVISIPITFSLPDVYYPLLSRFIEQFRRWDRGVRITSLSITSDASEGEVVDTVQVSLVVEALFSGQKDT